ncbi:MAG: aldehyde ferredoxin oxidoreductase family protein [Candidatus Nezhaarchaeota archaeon]|nr:aldehyde ferredoxin oxidoreductase family protein [Candidatus Nezhaarchaeota archaeon]
MVRVRYGGYMGKVLRVDLSRRRLLEEDTEEGFANLFIGGKGYAWLLYKELRPGVDPLSPDNKVIVATGPLTGTAAVGFASKYVILTKSPLTGAFLDTYAGGHFGARLKFAGYDAVVIEGRADRPVYLWISDGKAEVRDASGLWGRTVSETDRLVKEEVGDRDVSVACIGPAGERLVRFACVSNDLGREAGRGGAGAVLGSKRLKAIAVRGDGRVSIAKTEAFENAVREVRELVQRSPVLSQVLPSFGTPAFVSFANITGGWCVRNYQTGFFERADELSGERMREKMVVRSAACFNCVAACRKISEIKQGPYAGTRLEGPEFESIALLGANCGVGSLETVAYAAHLCDEYGMDTISTGALVAFAMELYEKGLLSREEAGGLDLRFGSEEALVEVVRMIGERRGLGGVLAEGSRRAAEKIGRGAEYYATHIKGLENPAWDARAYWGHALSMAVSDRGACHLHSFVLASELAGIPEKLDRFSTEGKALRVKDTEEQVAANDTLVHCLFYMFTPLFPEHSVKLLTSATGMELDVAAFLKVGERVLNLTRMFNVREGFSRKDDVLPRRLMERPHTSGASKDRLLTKEMLDKMLDEYYDLRGWVKETGVPSEGKLEELGLKKLLPGL